MRKTLVLAASILCCSLAFAQEAEGDGGAAHEFSVIARAEYLSGDNPLGNSCLYALADGSFSEVFSYSASLHLLSSAPGDLYAATLHPGESSWLDWAYVSGKFSNLEISLGKDMLPWGTYEMDEYDFDIHYPLASSVWNALPIYQWGGRVSWLPAQEIRFDADLRSSPFAQTPFGGRLFSMGIRARYEKEDSFGMMVAYNILDRTAEDRVKVVSTGVHGNLGKAHLTADFNSKIGDEDNVFADGVNTSFSCTYPFSDEFELMLKYNVDDYDSGNLVQNSAGLALHWYPFESLRVHAVGARSFGDNYAAWTFGVGLTWKFTCSL